MKISSYTSTIYCIIKFFLLSTAYMVLYVTYIKHSKVFQRLVPGSLSLSISAFFRIPSSWQCPKCILSKHKSWCFRHIVHTCRQLWYYMVLYAIRQIRAIKQHTVGEKALLHTAAPLLCGTLTPAPIQFVQCTVVADTMAAATCLGRIEQVVLAMCTTCVFRMSRFSCSSFYIV